MSDVYYKMGSRVKNVWLDEGAYIGPGTGARGYGWDYDLGTRSIANVVRRAREATVDICTATQAQADELVAAFESDMAAQEYGKLVADGWEQRVAWVGMDPGIVGPSVTMQFSVVLLDGMWSKERTVSFAAGSVASSGDWLDFPRPYPYDFASPAVTDRVNVESPSNDAPLRLVIYGPATNPFVTIGANLYQWIGTVPNGGYLDIDARGGKKSITLVRPDGSTSDVFSGGVRRGGLGGGSYIFQPLTQGVLSVAWDRSFAFDLTYLEQRSTPPFVHEE